MGLYPSSRAIGTGQVETTDSIRLMHRTVSLLLVPALLGLAMWSALDRGGSTPQPARLVPARPFPEGLHVSAYGRVGDPTIVYLHGGPGHNASLFEAAGAGPLAAEGFRVLVYDRRGCGRSKDVAAAYTFDEVLSDLAHVIDRDGARRVALLGHSWGGIVGAKFAAAHPENVSHLVLLGAPVSHQRMCRSILRSCRAVLRETAPDQLAWIDRIEALDPTSLEYNGYVFARAMACKLYQPASRTDDALALVDALKRNEDSRYFGMMTREPVAGFQANERYTTIDTAPDLQQAIAAGVIVSGLYGSEDGLFDAPEREQIEGVIGPNAMYVVEGASHNVFVDQRKAFLELAAFLLR